MKEVVYTTQYKKDYKRYKNQNKVVEKLKTVISLLMNESTLPDEYKLHALSGDYTDHFECHIESDTLLIWMDKEKISLVRMGSHAELFGKGKKR